MTQLPKDPDFVKEIDESLDAFEKDLAGIPAWNRAEAPSYLTMGIDELRRKDPIELVEAVFLLNQYGLNIQRLINKLRAWERYCLSRLDALEAVYIQDVPMGYGFNEMAKMARNNPEPCKKINEFLRKTRMQLDRLYGIPDHVKIMADTIRDMKFLAIKREKDARE